MTTSIDDQRTRFLRDWESRKFLLTMIHRCK